MNIFRGIAEGLEAMMRGLSAFARSVGHVVSSFFHGLVEFVERMCRWIADTTVRIKNYLIRLAKALGQTIWALCKLSLFYVPALICLVVFLFNHERADYLSASILMFSSELFLLLRGEKIYR